MSSSKNKPAQVLRKKLAEVGQNAVAAALNVDEGTISRWKSEGRIDQMGAVLEALGLKAVPVGYQCVKAEELTHVLYWARKGMEAVKTADDLVFEDDE